MTMIKQVRSVLDERIELTVPARPGEDLFKEFKDKIRVSMLGSPSVGALEDVHFHFAEFCRRISMGGLTDLNDHEIVRFYLWPKFEEVPRSSIDKIIYGIPNEEIERAVSQPL